MKKRKQRGGEEHRPWDAWWGSLGSSGLRAVMRIFNGSREERKGEMLWVVNGVRGYKGNEENKRKRERKRESGVS